MIAPDIFSALDDWMGGGPLPPVDQAKITARSRADGDLSKPDIALLSNLIKPEVQNGEITGRPVSIAAVAKPVATISAPDGGSAPLKKPEGNDDGSTWTADEVILCEARALGFTAKGIPGPEADLLAARLVDRDRQWDDRRNCVECLSFQAGACRQRIAPIGETTLYTLHRCRRFQLDGVSND